jgi:hypothetical protein
MKYQFTKKDKKEIKALLTFLSGVLQNSPIKRIEFVRSKTNDRISIQRWEDESKNEFQEIHQIISKKKTK